MRKDRPQGPSKTRVSACCTETEASVIEPAPGLYAGCACVKRVNLAASSFSGTWAVQVGNMCEGYTRLASNWARFLTGLVF